MSKQATIAVVGGVAAFLAARAVQDVTNQRDGAIGIGVGCAGAAVALFLTLQVIR